MIVKSVNIGAKRTIDYKGKIVETGIFKFPVKQAIFLGEEDVEKDAVIDRKYHGGIEQAVYGYSENHYEYWKKLYPKLDWQYGMFGENLTISNLEEGIYSATELPNANGQYLTFSTNEKNEEIISNIKPLDFSITKNVATIMLVAILMFLLFSGLAKSFAQNKGISKGLGRFFEPIILYIRDEIAIPNIGEKKYKNYMSFLLTVFLRVVLSLFEYLIKKVLKSLSFCNSAGGIPALINLINCSRIIQL